MSELKDAAVELIADKIMWFDHEGKLFSQGAQGILHAYHNFLTSQGFVIVPREPTKEMCMRAHVPGRGPYCDQDFPNDWASKAYRAMIASVDGLGAMTPSHNKERD